jgi:hypothetical protein
MAFARVYTEFFLLLVYVLVVIFLVIYVIRLLRRQALAQERIASAIERIASRPAERSSLLEDDSGAGAST